MKKILKAAIVAALYCRVSAYAEVPQQMNFQGRIELPAAEIHGEGGAGNIDNSRSIPFTGAGRFRFAIVSSTGGVFWTNVADEFSVPPSQSVPVPVNDGIFNVALGDPALGMPPVTPGIFSGADRLLRIFFQGEIIQGKKTKLTAERELLPPQKLLTVPFAFQSAVAQQAIDKQTIGTLLAGATVYGQFAIAQNAIILGSATVYGNVRGLGGFTFGHTFAYDNIKTIAFNKPQGYLITTPLSELNPDINPPPWPIAGGPALNVEAAGGLYLNQVATGPVSIAAGGGVVLISTPSASGNVGIGTANPAFKLHISSGAGETGDILVVSTGASDIFRVNGLGEVRANKYYGDGSALTGIAGGAAGPSLEISTINASAATPYGGVNITTNVFISQGNLAIGLTATTETLHVAGTTRFDGALKLRDDYSVESYPDELIQTWWNLPDLNTSAVLYAKQKYGEEGGDFSAGNVIYLAPKGSLSPGQTTSQGIFFAGGDPVDPDTGRILSGFSGTLFESQYFDPYVRTYLFGSSNFDTWDTYYHLFLSSFGGFIFGGKGYSGNSGSFGYDTNTRNFWVSGTKSFVQDYPGEPSKTITCYSMEGPEAGIYIRGTARLGDGKAKVTLPDYFTVVASTSLPMTVQATPRGECNGLYVFKSAPDELEIRELGGGKSAVEFDYFVQAVRKGYENVPVVQELGEAPEAYQAMKLPPKEAAKKLRGKPGKPK